MRRLRRGGAVPRPTGGEVAAGDRSSAREPVRGGRVADGLVQDVLSAAERARTEGRDPASLHALVTGLRSTDEEAASRSERLARRLLGG